MKRQLFARTAAGAVAVILLLACASTAAALEEIQITETKTFDVGAQPEIDISTISQEEAVELVADDGYFGIEQTSDRIVDFAIAAAA